MRGVYPAILVTFVVLPSTSRAIFQTWSCESFGDDDAAGSTRSFMRQDLSVDCASEQHARLEATSWVFFVLWPILVPAWYMLLLWHAHAAIQQRKPTFVSMATRFLWRDYREQFFWFEPVEMVRKLALTSFVLFVDTNEGYAKLARLLVGSLATIFFLALTLGTQPYRSARDNALAAGTQLLLALAFISAIAIKLCDETKEGEWGDDPCANIVGLSSDVQVASIMIATTVVMVVAVVALLSWQLWSTPKPQVVKLRKTGFVPILQLQSGHRWHLFLSHIWGTGQDQVAVIKRQLQLMLPGCSIFLDVDDLVDIGELEEYIDCTATMLFFLSRSYFKSANCLREIRSAKAKLKPIVLIHEADVAHGGAPLEALIDECPESLREFVFGGAVGVPDGETLSPSATLALPSARHPIPWHRIFELQVVSLKLIVVHVVNTSNSIPKHVHASNFLAKKHVHDELTLAELSIDGEHSSRRLTFDEPVVLWASQSNPNASRAARELATGLQSAGGEGRLKPWRKNYRAVAQKPWRKTHGGRNSDAPAPSAISHVSVVQVPPPSLAMAGGEGCAGDEPHATHMLLYLNGDTWIGERGVKLADEVRAARAAGLPILMLHEQDPVVNGCLFSHFFETTPQDLIVDGLYKALAIAWHPGVFRPVCVVQAGLGIFSLNKEFRKEKLKKRYAEGAPHAVAAAEATASPVGRRPQAKSTVAPPHSPAVESWQRRCLHAFSGTHAVKRAVAPKEVIVQAVERV